MGRMATQSPLNAASRIIQMLFDNTIGRIGGIRTGPPGLAKVMSAIGNI